MANKLSYYNYAALLSHNGRYNVVVGGRGLGKTYGAKRKVIRDAIKSLNTNTGICDQFIYLRRYKPELQMSKPTFFADIEHEFPEWDFRNNSNEAQMSPVESRDDKKRYWYTIGYFIPLSIAQTFKSVAFPHVKMIIFDEFIIEKGAIHYLPNEATVFNNFFSTVDRYQDKTRVLFLANSVTITNPYFIEYKINPKACDDRGFLKIYKGFLVCHFVDSKQFNSEVYQTIFGKFIEGTEYAQYAVDNSFPDNHEALILAKTSRSIYVYTIETEVGTFSVWYDRNGHYFCQVKRPKSDELIFTLVPEKMDENKTLSTFTDPHLSALRLAFKRATVRFDAPPTRNAFLEIFRNR